MICDVSLHSRQKLSMAIVFLAKIIRIGMKKFRPKNRVYGGTAYKRGGQFGCTIWPKMYIYCINSN